MNVQSNRLCVSFVGHIAGDVLRIIAQQSKYANILNLYLKKTFACSNTKCYPYNMFAEYME